jgi:hypothetical protein
MRFRFVLIAASAACFAGTGTAQAPPPGPDLAVSIDDKGVAVVRNVGKADVKTPFEITLTCKVKGGGLCGAPFQNGASKFMVTLKPGAPGPVWQEPGVQTMVVSWPGSVTILLPVKKTYPKGDYEVTVLADTKNEVAESDEANNSATATIHSDHVPASPSKGGTPAAKPKS